MVESGGIKWDNDELQFVWSGVYFLLDYLKYYFYTFCKFWNFSIGLTSIN